MVIEEVDDFGDFVQDDDEVMELEYLTEPWSDYDINETDKVFYPISLGEELNQRYLIEHKLGTGGGSTVWMAYDRLDKKEVALKIMASGSWADNEIRMHDVIRGGFLAPGDGSGHLFASW
ncbi:uncharacterized protein BDV14DRAFT_82319 [Aspergillus stella-maris]|uniref:uncharacterized protein n=1 Tax=Aspergillus stella-maris TaxID=1810926 RepID=UPI003CCD921C